MNRWFESRFTGLFCQFGRIEPRPHDPDVQICGGTIRPGVRSCIEMNVGGAGWHWAAAEAACLGEAIERLQPQALSVDRSVEASFQSWPLDEPAIEPEQWVLFHAEQYAQSNFPFRRFTHSTVCRWVCFREVPGGQPHWVPEDFAFLSPDADGAGHICPGISTGLSCGKSGQPVILRGLQEVIERDALVGAWWRSYPLEEWDAEEVFGSLGPDLVVRLKRPNLRWRFYRVASPFSSHVTIVSIEGEDHEGFCFSVGSACRERREASWCKAILEAVQGRHYVRHLKRDHAYSEMLRDFPDHALHYSLYPDQLATTVLENPGHAGREICAGEVEGLPALAERLGRSRPVLARSMTPPALARENLGWVVWRVTVPGMQPLHGNDTFAHLGGPLWCPRGLASWASIPPHPFP